MEGPDLPELLILLFSVTNAYLRNHGNQSLRKPLTSGWIRVKYDAQNTLVERGKGDGKDVD
jgi:hypothetical protein